MAHIVFVYGTLLSGLPNHSLLKSQVFLGNASTEPRFTMVSLGAFPGVVSGGKRSVVGELYKISPATLVRLDRLESNGSFYTRRKTLIGNQLAWIYLLPVSFLSYPKVEPADWRRSMEAPCL